MQCTIICAPYFIQIVPANRNGEEKIFGHINIDHLVEINNMDLLVEINLKKLAIAHTLYAIYLLKLLC